MRSKAVIMLFSSVVFDFRNFLLAGTLKNRFCIMKLLPTGHAAGSWLSTLQPAMVSRVPISSVAWRDFSSTCATAAIAAEAHGVEGEEVVGLPYLRCGVTLEGKARIGFRHALSVVNHLDGCLSCIHHKHVDALCSGINGILHQFLDNRRRTLYHFACGYLVGYGIGEELDYIAHSYLLFLKLSAYSSRRQTISMMRRMMAISPMFIT